MPIACKTIGDSNEYSKKNDYNKGKIHGRKRTNLLLATHQGMGRIAAISNIKCVSLTFFSRYIICIVL